MRKFVGRLATGIVVASAPMAMAVATPGVGSAQCENGWWIRWPTSGANASRMRERLVVGSGRRRL